MYYNDHDALQEVDKEARRNPYLKDTLVQASRSGDVEIAERTLQQVLASKSIYVSDFFTFLQKAIQWFRNLF